MLLLLLLVFPLRADAVVLDNNACTHLGDYPFRPFSKDCYVNPNVDIPAPDMIELAGYPVLSYEVTTLDGYILHVFRIPPAQNDTRKNKQPVFLDHGIFVDSASWVYIGDRSLAFNLAELGYDVWLFNQRDTRYSRQHTVYRDTDPDYWRYSLDDVALFDTRAGLSLVANETGMVGDIVYIGHSRGTTLIFMYAAEYPEEVQSLLKGIIALSPIVYLDLVWYLKIIAPIGIPLFDALMDLDITVLLPDIVTNNEFFRNFCTFLPHLCYIGLQLSSGKTVQFLSDDLLLFYNHYPGSLAVMQVIQFLQIYYSGNFQKYDYGSAKNLALYGQEDPPLYNLSNIQLPCYLYYGKHDILIKSTTVHKLYDSLGSQQKFLKSVPVGNNDKVLQFGHNDFIWSEYIKEYLYKDLFHVLENDLK